MNRATSIKKPIRSRICLRETTWRMRRHQGIGGLLRSVRDLSSNMYDAAEDLIQVRQKLKKSRTKIAEMQKEMEQLKRNLSSKKTHLKKTADEIRKAIKDLHAPNNLSDLDEEEKTVLKLDLFMAEEDVVEAYNHVHDAEDDLSYEILSELLQKEFRHDSNAEQGIRQMDSIKLPNITSKGVVPQSGIMKMNRNKCCICLEAKIDCVLLYCGHVCTCYSCIELQADRAANRTCPVCRTTIKLVLKTYIV